MTPRNAYRGLAPSCTAGVVLGLALAPATSSAQDRLLNLRTAGVGVMAEEVSFGAGVWQTPLPGQDSTRVRRAVQFSVPLTAAVPLGREWIVDATTVYANGSVHYECSSGRRIGTRCLAVQNRPRKESSSGLRGCDHRHVIPAAYGRCAPPGLTPT